MVWYENIERSNDYYKLLKVSSYKELSTADDLRKDEIDAIRINDIY